jgi:hypothetical protein
MEKAGACNTNLKLENPNYKKNPLVFKFHLNWFSIKEPQFSNSKEAGLHSKNLG